jgi:hypothetical protein
MAASVAIARGNEWPTSHWHNWMESQTSAAGGWCCDISDGHLLEINQWDGDSEHYRVEIEGTWVTLADYVLVDPHKGGPNPTGKAILWYGPGPGAHSQEVRLPGERVVYVYCFAPGPQG